MAHFYDSPHKLIHLPRGEVECILYAVGWIIYKWIVAPVADCQLIYFILNISPLFSWAKLSTFITLQEKAMAAHSGTLAWEIPWTEKPGGLQSMGSLRVGHGWAASLPFFTFLHWRRKWQPTPVFAWRIPGTGEPGGLPSMGSHGVGHDWSDLAAAAATFSSAATFGQVTKFWPLSHNQMYLVSASSGSP